MNYRLLSSLRKQLAYEILFVKNVSKPYRDPKKELDIVEFEYKGQPCKLILNGNIKLESKQTSTEVESFRDLIQGLIQIKFSG